MSHTILFIAQQYKLCVLFVFHLHAELLTHVSEAHTGYMFNYRYFFYYAITVNGI